MANRVFSTDEAKESIVKMQAIVNGPLTEQLIALDKAGQTLSDANIWDGVLAQRYRADWPIVHENIKEMVKQLEELRIQVEKINESIMLAGGN